MPVFLIKGLRKDGNRSSFRIDASTEHRARVMAENQGISASSIKDIEELGRHYQRQSYKCAGIALLLPLLALLGLYYGIKSFPLRSKGAVAAIAANVAALIIVRILYRLFAPMQ